MINITIEVSETTTVNLKTEDFKMAENFIEQYAVEDSKVFFSVLYSKETAHRILHNWKKEFSSLDMLGEIPSKEEFMKKWTGKKVKI
jgi:hypothetical protein